MALSITSSGVYFILTGTRQEVLDYLSANNGNITVMGFENDLILGTTSVLLSQI